MKKISLSESEANDLLDLYQSEIDRAQRRINNLKTIIHKLSEGHSFEHTEEEPVKVKGKRGRKPKAKVAVEVKPVIKTKEVKEIKEKEIAKEPKKRGRKPKAKVAEIKAEPKKRGPKPKVKAAEAKVKKEKNTIKEKEIIKKPKKIGRKKKVSKVKAAPKKRGRKPKSLRKPIKGGKGSEKVKWNDFIIDTITEKNSLMLASSITRAALEKFEIPESDRDRVRMAISTTLTKMVKSDKNISTYSQEGIRGSFYGLAGWFNDNAQLKDEYKSKLM